MRWSLQIPEEDLERIFDPFHTTRGAPDTSGELTPQLSDSGGTGLGLSISAKLAEQNRGFIKAKNLPSGVAFTPLCPPGISMNRSKVSAEVGYCTG